MGETKHHAAHGLCRKCYRKFPQPKISAESRATRAGRLHQRNENRTRYERELQNRRCETCERLLHIVRGKLDPAARFCDPFCYLHSPRIRAKRNMKRMNEATEAELQRREIEAWSHSERDVA